MNNPTKEELQERSLLVRQLEAACKAEYPTTDELNYRIALMKRLGLVFGLKEVRTMQITGPVSQTPGRPPAPARGK